MQPPRTEKTDRKTRTSLLLLVLGTLSGFGVNIALARWASGPEAFGEYAFLLNLALFLAVVAALGVPPAGLRFMAEGLSRHDLAAVGRVRRSGNRLICLGLGITVLLSAVGILLIEGGIRLPVGCILLLIPVMATRWVLETHAKVQHRVLLAVVPSLIVLPLGQAGLAYGWFLWTGEALSPSALLLSYAVAGSLALLMSWMRLRFTAIRFPGERVELDALGPPVGHRALLKVGLPILLVACLSVIMGQVDVFMLRTMAGLSETGIYFAAVRLASVLALPLLAVNVLAGARYAALWNAGQVDAFRALARSYARFIMLGTLPLFLVLSLAGGLFLDWHGAAYRAGQVALGILLVGQLVNAFAGSTALILNMTGYQTVVAVIFATCCCLNVVGNWLLIPRFGIEGAAVTSTISLTIWNLWLWILILRKLDADTSWLSILRADRSGPIAP